MPAQQLRCEESVVPVGDLTGEHALECGAVALACAQCGESAGCHEHAQFCPKCGEAVCVWCEDEHVCLAGTEGVRAA